MADKPLAGTVAVVAGGTRGCGRGIAVELGTAGATVYVTGRSTRGRPSEMGRPETIEETAGLVDAAGGRGVPVAVDHLRPEEVAALAGRVRSEAGRLDVLVNDIWGADRFARFGVPFWERPLETGLRTLDLGLRTHLITSWHLVPLLAERGAGLVVEVTDAAEQGYRDDVYYDLAKYSVVRHASGQAAELRPFGVAAVAVTPGFLRSEAMLDHFGVTEQDWRSGIAQDRYFAASETPRYLGRGVAALAADPAVLDKSGKLLASWELAELYGFADVDGRRPHWPRDLAAIQSSDRTPAEVAGGT
ncbi:SDR family oxidoreductase [Nonomuraea typhae]|uniref:SDR family oxidoreductase n=1 Tax=Nonomuraea typhae TaxID=2603600 RepID=A0ABW7ZBF5_9ACTN